MNAFEAVPLRGLDDASRRRIEASGQTRSLAPGQVLYDVGEDGDVLFVVLRGRVSVAGAAGSLRTAEPGHTIGEEAMLGLPRRARASALGEAEVFSVTASLLHRAWTRAGGRPVAAAERRRLERAVIGDLLRSVLPQLGAGALDVLLDGASLRTVEAGTPLARAGDPCPDAALMLDGVAHVRAAGSREVTRVVASPDALGVSTALEATRWSEDVVAAGTCQVVWLRSEALRSALGNAGLEEASRRRAEARGEVLAMMQVGPRDEAVDVDRLSRARSLMILDQDACVRCGACTRACASSHDDGFARMRRDGPRLMARLGSSRAPAVPWLVAQACQHCSSPACLPDCPTAAITRGPDGVVQIDPALCTGCGACAKACPWDAIEMAPRPSGTPSPSPGPFEQVAVKCDLCVGASGGPACVQICPTQALARVDAGSQIVEAAALLGRPLAADPRPCRPWPWLGSLGMAVALAMGAWGSAQHAAGWIAGAGPGLWMGWIAAVSMLASVLYAALRRRRWPLGRGAVGMASHGVFGALTLGAAWAHAGGFGSGGPGVLAGVLVAAVGLGLLGAWAYRVVPRRLTRLEPRAQDERDRAPDDADALMKAVGGRGDALKRLTAAVLLPYALRPGGGLVLLLSGRSLREEQARLRASLRGTLGAQRIDRMEGLDDVLVAVVSVRAAGPRRLLGALLRGWLVGHVVLCAIALVLMVLHVLERFA